MDKNLLIMTEMPQYFVSLADKNFNTFRFHLVMIIIFTKKNSFITCFNAAIYFI